MDSPFILDVNVLLDPENPDLAKIPSLVEKIPGTKIRFSTARPSPDILGNVDVAVACTPLPASVADLRRKIGRGVLVLCLTLEEESGLSDEEVSLVDDIWILPFGMKRICKRLANIVGKIQKECEAGIRMRWFDSLIDIMEDLVWVKGADGVHLKVNQAFCKAAGKTRRMIEGRTHSEIWGGDDAGCRASETEVIKNGTVGHFEEMIVTGGEKRHLVTHKAPFYGPGDTILGTIGIGHDITSMLNLNMEIEIFIEAMPFPLVLTREDGRISHLNKKFEEIFGESRKDMIGTVYAGWQAWAFEKSAPEVTGSAMRFVHGDGKLIVSIIATPYNDIFGNNLGTIYIFRDVTAEKQLEAHIWKAANEDPLTGLANRHALSSWHAERKDGERLHLLYIDLDNFKQVNDRYGHKAGDDVLRHMAKAIRDVFPNDFAARLGGDEFLICVTEDPGKETLETLAASLQERLQSWFSSDERLRDISLSIGIRPDCDPTTPIGQLIREADETMYLAKKNGKARSAIWRGGTPVIGDGA